MDSYSNVRFKEIQGSNCLIWRVFPLCEAEVKLEVNLLELSLKSRETWLQQFWSLFQNVKQPHWPALQARQQ